VNEGVALARRRGILAELPKEVQFDVTLIRKWQSPDLVIVGTDITTGTDKGTSTSTGTQSGSSTRTGSEKSESTSQSTDNGSSSGQNANYTYSD